jgi:hypothetical protein
MRGGKTERGVRGCPKRKLWEKPETAAYAGPRCNGYGKRGFSSEKVAKTIANMVNSAGLAKKKLRHYKCPICNNYHLTSQELTEVSNGS